ncbi:MAG: SDR family oxidoreductase [Nitrospira sp.]|nr:SDR family oxidoreductase [Nitrospira sp.]
MSKRTVVVTGGSRGLGAVIVHSLLESGHRVATCSRTKSEFLAELEAGSRFAPDFFWRPCTIGEADEADAYMKAVAEWTGSDGLWGLVNNAGIAMAGILATFPNIESERIIKINLLGAIQIARAFSQQMLKSNRGGRIINISSIIGTRGYNGLSAYSASKAGLDGFSRALARELGRRQITVNSVAPGYIRTEMSATLTEDQLTQIVNRTPLGRLATAEDLVGVIKFLLSKEAAMITGQTILVDGGISC